MADIENRPAGKPRARSRAGTVTHAADEPVWGGNAAAAGEHARAMDLQAELQATQARFAELEREAGDLRRKLKTAEDYGDAITIERDKALSDLANMQDERDELRARLRVATESARVMEAKVDAYEVCLASAQLIPARPVKKGDQ